MTSLTPLYEKQIKVEKVRRKALNDLYFFCREILGYDAMTPQPHKELCDFTISELHKKLILMPRGSFKSSVVTIGYALWRLVKDRNLRILISSETYAQSKTFLRAIKTHIEQNDTFRAVFGDIRPATLESSWRQEEITVAGRTRVGREPSISCSGIDQAKTGFHYDLIILDDIVSNNNINTPEQINKTIDHYKLLLSILEPNSDMIIIGTRYSYADLYGHLLEEERESFAIHKRSAVSKDGSLLFPSRLTKDFLAAQKKSQGAAMFANQYQNEPIDQDSAMFKQDWLKFYEKPPLALRHFMCIDPAGSNSKSADFTAICVAGIDCDNNIYVLEAIQTKATIADILNMVFDLVLRYNIADEGCVGLEVNAMQNTLKYIFSEEMNRRNVFFAIKELKGSSLKTKPNRIKALQPYFENGKIFLKKDQYELIDQITRYPKTRHDDSVDSLAYILQVMAPADPTEYNKWESSPLPYNDMRVWQAKEERAKIRYVRRKRL